MQKMCYNFAIIHKNKTWKNKKSRSNQKMIETRFFVINSLF